MHNTVYGQSKVSRHAVTVTKLTAAIYMVSSCSMILFGIGIPPIWQGLVGILVSLEGFYGAISLDVSRVRLFMLGLALNGCIVSLVLGVLALKGISFVDCGFDLTDELINSGLFGPADFSNTTANADFENCLNATRLYAQVQLFTGVAVAVLLLFFMLPAYREINRGVRAAKRDNKEKELETFIYNLD